MTRLSDSNKKVEEIMDLWDRFNGSSSSSNYFGEPETLALDFPRKRCPWEKHFNWIFHTKMSTGKAF
jgi:hypothetical protein